jgi:hypothetical protein
MQRIQQLAKVASASLVFVACSGDSIQFDEDAFGDDEEAFDSMPSAGATESGSDLQSTTAEDPTVWPAAVGNLTAERRRALGEMASELLEGLIPEPPPDRVGADDDDDERVQHDATSDDDERPVDAVTGSDTATSSARSAWNEFLDSVVQNPEGSFAIGDTFVGDDAQLLGLFEALYTQRLQKGLILASTAWPLPRALSVCWTPDSNATAAEKQRVAQLVNARWAATSDVTFDFGTAPNMRTCAETNCGLFVCPTGGEQIRIYQNSVLTRGCAAIGSFHTSTSNLNCGFGVFHDYASMYLPTAASPNSSDNFVDYTSVHEFGHAMGVLHEQARSDYNYLVPGPRNCASADSEQTVPGSNPPQRVAATPGQANIGFFDDFSIMNYCQQEENLTNFFEDPRASQLSVGDIFSVRAMYTAPSSSVRVRFASWMPATIRIRVQATNFDVASSAVQNTINTGISVVTGNSYTALTTALGGSRLRCYAFGQARTVFNTPQISPPGGFTSNPAVSECYDAAALSVTALRLL